MAELNALNAHLTASLLHFESLARRREEGRERPIVIHNHYPRGILNITRADEGEENGQERLRMARGGEVRLGLKIARQRCQSVRNATSGIEIMALRL